jgi:hypothetical protein
MREIDPGGKLDGCLLLEDKKGLADMKKREEEEESEELTPDEMRQAWSDLTGY